MEKRIPASTRTRQSLSDLIEGRLSSPDGRGELVKLATRLIVEEALRRRAGTGLGEATTSTGRPPARATAMGSQGSAEDGRGGYRICGAQVAGRDEPFRSEIREHLKGRTQALEDLAVELLARGLSVRDIEDAFRDETGRLLLSKTAVSEIGERLWRTTRSLPPATSASTRSSTSLSTASPSASARARSASRCWRPGASPGPEPRCFCTSWLAPRRTPKRSPPSSRTCAPAALAIRCWSSPTAHRGSSRRSRPASRARSASVASRTACATWLPSYPRTCGQSSRPAQRPPTRLHPRHRP